MSRSSVSSALGVPLLISGAMTEMDWSLPGRLFSLPPTREGRVDFEGAALPVVLLNSGVSDSRRDVVEALGRFWPRVDLGRVADLGGAGCFCDFFEGASGCGHSTSWVRSRREASTHSNVFQY